MKQGCWTYAKKPLIPQLKDIEDVGFDYAEVGLAELETLNEEYKDLPDYVPVEAAHLPEINFSKNEVKKVKDFIQGFDAETFIIHAYSPEMPTKNNFDKKMEVLKKLAQMAEEQGKKLVVENTIEKAELMRKILDGVPSAGYCLDVAHANLSSDPIQNYIQGFGDELVHIHASDNLGGSGEGDDLHLPVGSGEIKFEDLIIKLKEIGFKGRVTHEVRTFDKDYRRLSMEKWLEFC